MGVSQWIGSVGGGVTSWWLNSGCRKTEPANIERQNPAEGGLPSPALALSVIARLPDHGCKTHQQSAMEVSTRALTYD
jgi:hypothetical protein